MSQDAPADHVFVPDAFAVDATFPTVSAGRVWDVIGQWTWGAYGPVTIDPNDATVRHLGRPDAAITTKLLERSDEERRLRYTIVAGPFPISDYTGLITVFEEADGARVRYAVTYKIAEDRRVPFHELFAEHLRLGLRILQLELTAHQLETSFLVRAPLARLWSTIGNWDDVSWKEGVHRAHMERSGDRILTDPDGRVVREHLYAADPDASRLIYDVTATPLPVSLMRCTLHLVSETSCLTRCHVVYRFLPQATVEPRDSEVAVRAHVARETHWLRDRFDTRAWPDPPAHPIREWGLLLRYWYLVLLVRVNQLVWRICSRFRVDPAIPIAGEAKLRAADPLAEPRRREMEEAWGRLNVQPLYRDRPMRTRKALVVPRDQRFPLWWAASLYWFQGNVRLLLGPSAIVSMLPTKVRTRTLLDRVWAFLPDRGYNKLDIGDDDIFAQMYLGSTGATLLRRCHDLPDRLLPISRRQLGPTGEAALRAGQLYAADFEDLEGLSWEMEDVPAPVVIFQETSAHTLKPLLIQLNGLCFTPQDSPALWTTAKMWVDKAYVVTTRTVHHGLLSHFTWAGTFAIATYGCLAPRHPLRRFLAPFTRYTLHVNKLASELIVNESGALAGQVTGFEGSVKLMERMEARASYADLVLPVELKGRGMHNFAGAYPYRDDALPLWAAMKAYAAGWVALHYPSVNTISGDEELQTWAYEVSRVIVDFPSPVSTVAQLTEVLTAAVFAVVLHQVHNAPAAHHTIVPGQPTSLGPTIRGVPLPRFKGDGPPDLWKFASLGNVVISLLFDATLTSYNKRINLCFGLEDYCTTDPERDVVRQFADACHRISADILARNRSRSLRFNYLDPLCCSQSVCS